jgi:hypothetical protein
MFSGEFCWKGSRFDVFPYNDLSPTGQVDGQLLAYLVISVYSWSLTDCLRKLYGD